MVFICVVGERLAEHGTRLATWTDGISIGCCDDCYGSLLEELGDKRLHPTADAGRIREMGLHLLHLGQLPPQ